MGSKLWFRYGAMGCGKSTQLLQIAHNYEQQGMSVLLLTSALDTRSGIGMVTSRLGPQREAFAIPPSGLTELQRYIEEFLALEQPLGAVLCDEAQFLAPQQAKYLHQLVHSRNIPVMCFGLRADFRGDPFPGSTVLLALADDVEELRTVCKCGAKATMNMRVDSAGKKILDGPQVLIGDAQYRAVCPRCYYHS